MSYSNLILKNESSKCLLCSDAPRAKSCKKGVPIDRIICSVNFDNISGARFLLKNNECAECIDGDCVSSCNRGKLDTPVDITKLASLVSDREYVKPKNVDLLTDLCGVKCENPFFFRPRLSAVTTKWLPRLLMRAGQEWHSRQSECLPRTRFRHDLQNLTRKIPHL